MIAGVKGSILSFFHRGPVNGQVGSQGQVIENRIIVLHENGQKARIRLLGCAAVSGDTRAYHGLTRLPPKVIQRRVEGRGELVFEIAQLTEPPLIEIGGLAAFVAL